MKKYFYNSFSSNRLSKLLINIKYFFCLSIMLVYSSATVATTIDNWNKLDIGNEVIPGQASQEGSLITIIGSGKYLAEIDDDFYYVYKSFSGDSSITVKVVDVEKSNRWATGGVMFRETLESNSKNVALNYSAHKKLSLQWREAIGNREIKKISARMQDEMFLKLERTGDTFNAFYSQDNLDWILYDSKTVDMADNIYLGLMVSSYRGEKTTKVEFDSLSVISDNAEITCESARAQCGSISNGLGDTLQCGGCSANSSCSENNQCVEISDEIITASCLSSGAQCGFIRGKQNSTLSCGSYGGGCGNGSSCMANRCEVPSGLNVLGKGNFEGISAYIPTRYSYEDQSVNKHKVEVSLLPIDRTEQMFPFESRTDMSNRKITVDLSDKVIGNDMTLSFKLMPSNEEQIEKIMVSESLEVKQNADYLSFTLGSSDGPITLLNDIAKLNTRSCNHVVLQTSNDKIRSWVNGQSTEMTQQLSRLTDFSGRLNVGVYNGKVWDLRVYERALNEQEIQEIGSECNQTVAMPLPDEAFPNYLCGAYYCIYWPENVTDTTFDSFQYQVNAHDLAWEHNVLNTGMYPHGGLYNFLDENKGYSLMTDNYRKSWVSKFNYDNPWSTHVIHENFHGYAKAAGTTNKWMKESTASWAELSIRKVFADDLLGMYTLMPYLALWTKQDTVYDDPELIQHSQGGHQYGAGVFHFYITNHVLNEFYVGNIYNQNLLNLAPLTNKPTEAIFNILKNAGYDMRDVFSDFAARVTTWDMDLAEQFIASEAKSFKRIKAGNDNKENPLPEAELDNKILEFYDVNGTTGWLTVPARYKIAAWAYNAYEVDVTESANYQVGINPAVTNPDDIEFRAQVVVYNEQTGVRTYHKVPNTEAGVASTVSVSANAGDKLYLVVATTPSTIFGTFDLYLYDYLVKRLN